MRNRFRATRHLGILLLIRRTLGAGNDHAIFAAVLDAVNGCVEAEHLLEVPVLSQWDDSARPILDELCLWHVAFGHFWTLIFSPTCGTIARPRARFDRNSGL
jgi:hypothetical protein